ncbi:MAG: hypothetical protein ACLQLT_09945 [Methylovirgula sp.]
MLGRLACQRAHPVDELRRPEPEDVQEFALQQEIAAGLAGEMGKIE